MPRAFTRRRFLEASAGAAVTAAIDPVAFARTPDGPNVVLFVVDSLRADAVYDNWVRTPNMDALRRRGLSFSNVHPEAMPTVPARNSILGGRRMFPFRGWHDRRGLIAAPGWSPLTHVDAALTSAFRKGGYYTAYVTDNPFLGFSLPYAPVRHSVHRFVRTGGQIGGNKPVSSVPKQVLNHWLYHSIAAREHDRVGLYLANSRVWESADNSYAAARLQERHRRARHRGLSPGAVLHGGGHLRAARAVDAAEALPRHVRRPPLARPRTVDAALHADRRLAGEERAAAPSCAA